MSPKRLVLVAGARPNFMKVAPIARALERRPGEFTVRLIHTGQHYDERMSAVFFEELQLTRPHVNLNVGSGSHAQQAAAMMVAFEPELLRWTPDLVLVAGDVNSTLACALVAAKLGIAVAHVEAGLRSFDRSMPEEINRIVTDQIADVLFTTEPSGLDNLEREGVARERIHFVGNVMIDTLLAYRERAAALKPWSRFGLERGAYVVLTLHRPTNVDEPGVFERIASALAEIASELPVVFPVHPRARAVVARSAVATRMVEQGVLRLTEPLGYLDFLGLMTACAAVITDSGGIQEETTVLGVPCLTVRENTERPVTLTEGTNQLVGTDPARMLDGFRRARAERHHARMPALWDGSAAERIVEVLATWKPSRVEREPVVQSA